MNELQLNPSDAFDFFSNRFPTWTGWLASLVIDQDANFIGADGTSKSISNQSDLQLLLALRSKASVIVTTGRTARAEAYKASKFAPIAFLTKDPTSLETIPAILKPGIHKHHFIQTNGAISETAESITEQLNSLGYETILFEGGPESLQQLIASRLPLQLVLAIATVPPNAILDISGLLSRVLPASATMKLQEEFQIGPNRICRLEKPSL